MRIAHNIRIRVFCKEWDDAEQVKKALIDIIPFDLEEEKLEIKTEKAELFEGRQMQIFSVFLKKDRHTNAFLKSLKKGLSDDQKNILIRQLDSRLDDQLHFFIRLDKNKLLNNEYCICDSGNCFHIDICVAAYPHKKEAARKLLLTFLK